MFDRDKWQEILFTISQNKLRTFLTGFSVAWGIFMLIVLLGAGTGLQNGAEEEFSDTATNSIWVNGGQTSVAYKGIKPGKFIRFNNTDYKDIQSKIDRAEKVSGRFNVPRGSGVSLSLIHI